jgi:hypothetical protein
MEAPKLETLPPPPNVVGALKAGFDTISTHLTAILLPLSLDLLLWLGPRLNVEKVFLPVLEDFRRIAETTKTPVADMNKFVEIYTQSMERFNLLAVLRTFPIGISSLLQGVPPASTPLGEPRTFQVLSMEGMFGWFILFTLVGWLGGAIYFRWVASLALPQGKTIRFAAVGQSFSLSILYTVLTFAIGMPFFFFILLLFVISPLLGQGLLLLLGFMSMWLVVPLFFAAHGIFIHSQNVFASILSSVKMARFTLPTSSMFVLIALVINIGLNYLWSIPKSDSWMLLIGIFGHAFITTALLAASFIYYRDMSVWLQTVFDKLKTGTATPQA